MFKKKTLSNDITKFLEEHKGDKDSQTRIKGVFGDSKLTTLLSVTFRSEPPILLEFVEKYISDLLDYAIKDKNKNCPENDKFLMISRNISIALSTPSNKLKEKLYNSDDFKTTMIDFINSPGANRGTSIHWGKIISSFVANPKYMFFRDKDILGKIIPKLISNCDYPGYRDLLSTLAAQNSDKNIFEYISKAIASNMLEYYQYKGIFDKIDEGKESKARKKYDLLYERTFYLLKIFNYCYNDQGDMLEIGDWKSRYKIVKNILEGIIYDLDKKLVLDAGVNALCIIINIINKSKDSNISNSDDDDDKNSYDKFASENIDRPNTYNNKIRQLIISTGKTFYHNQKLDDLKITPEITHEELFGEKLDLIIRTFPIFWESGIHQLSPLLFRGCKVDEDKNIYPESNKLSLTPSKVTKTITDKVCKWISIINRQDSALFGESSVFDTGTQELERKKAYKKLYKFIQKNNIIENLMKYFPEIVPDDKNKAVAFLNPFMIILSELLSVGYIKSKIDFNGAESVIVREQIKLCEDDDDDDLKVKFPPSMLTDEFSKFIFERVIPMSNEINKVDF